MKIRHALPLALLLAALPVLAQNQAPGSGVSVGEASAFRKLIPAEQLENTAAKQYLQMKQEAADHRALAPADHPQLKRLRTIAKRILPHASRFNPRAAQWKWEVNLIGSNQLNAFCMPGGKIAFYSGIIDRLKLTDDEIAIIMGHEVAHALREHAREQAGKNMATQLGRLTLNVLSEMYAGGRYADITHTATGAGSHLLSRKFSRDDETEADAVGLDLAARAGYDPRAGVSLWKKMGAASKGAPPQWLSTHPAGDNRIKEIERHLPAVMPLYESARANLQAQSALAQ